MAESVETGRRILEQRALHDALTGLGNRTLLEQRYRMALETGTAHRVSILFVDLDGFKLVNDSSGHLIGDTALQHVARRLEESIRADALVGRVGGDEFAVLVDWGDTSDPEKGSAAIAARILTNVAGPYEIGGREFVLSASIGIAHADATMSFDDVLRDADLAMYAGRELGPGSYSYFRPLLRTESTGRLARIAALRQAIETKAFVLHYQPLVELQTDRPVAVEALVRWPDPERGLISPAEFVPLAEETGLIVPLGEWVLREACRQTAIWDSTEPRSGGWHVGVNLSVRQLFDPGLSDSVRSALAESGIAATQLTLEITETAVMRDIDTAIDRLRDLRAMGVSLAIDDFGTGQSSLSYLRRFPATHLKIAREFADQIDASPRELAFVRAIVDLAHSLGHEVIAEGIETRLQSELVKGLGCDLAQGFYFARPVPADELVSAFTRLGSRGGAVTPRGELELGASRLVSGT